MDKLYDLLAEAETREHARINETLAPEANPFWFGFQLGFTAGCFSTVIAAFIWGLFL